MTQHINRDSWKHACINFACPVIGVLLGLFIGWIIGYIFLGCLIGLFFGIGISIGASLTREYDGKQFGGHWCWWDIFFDAIGLLTGTGLMVLIGWLIWK